MDDPKISTNSSDSDTMLPDHKEVEHGRLLNPRTPLAIPPFLSEYYKKLYNIYSSISIIRV
jgi:hypothetical protein